MQKLVHFINAKMQPNVCNFCCQQRHKHDPWLQAFYWLTVGTIQCLLTINIKHLLLNKIFPVLDYNGFWLMVCHTFPQANLIKKSAKCAFYVHNILRIN